MKTIFLDEVDSTNNYLKAHCNKLSGETAVTALRQVAGKGRLGHSWEGCEEMLPLSILFKNPPEPENLSARAGLAVCEALEESLEKPLEKAVSKQFSAGIKWPNDIILENHKVCGILCESVRVGACLNVICGIGINIAQSENYFKQVGLPNGGSILSITGLSIDRNELFERVAERVIFRCAMPFHECFDEYKKRVLNIGREVRLIKNGAEKIAFAEDVSEQGFLICRDENGVFEVNSGEVSVRGKEGYI